MIVSIHQPMYLPWIGYFNKIANSDIFVILDDVEYSKNDWFNRNKIKTPTGEQWLTVPVIYKKNSVSLIKNVSIDNNQSWNKKHLNSIKQNYSKASFYSEFIKFFEEIYLSNWNLLIDVNMKFLTFILKILELKTKIVFASQLEIQDKSTERLISICKNLGADTYLSGTGAKEYLATELFGKNNLKLIFQDFKYPEYKQLHGNFIGHLSVIDLLFNCGAEESRKLILGKKNN